jgi:hypothetical protein
VAIKKNYREKGSRGIVYRRQNAGAAMDAARVLRCDQETR